MKKKIVGIDLLTILLFVFFLFSIFKFDLIEGFLSILIKPKNIFIARVSLVEIAQQHISIVLISSFFSVLLALSIAIFARLSMMDEVERFILAIGTFGQTIPTVALLALLVPFLGYGFKPAIVALFTYGILPVLRNTIEGFNTIPEGIKESAIAMGMSRMQMMTRVELPLALPAIIAGIRISLILNISVATIGATVGLSGFGTLIVNGIRGDDTIMILKGAIPVSLMALTVESFFIHLEQAIRLSRQTIPGDGPLAR